MDYKCYYFVRFSFPDAHKVSISAMKFKRSHLIYEEMESLLTRVVYI